MRRLLHTGWLLLLTAAIVGPACAQQVDVANVKNIFKDNKMFTLSGGITANTMLFTGSDMQNRQPFTYMLAGNINGNIYGQVDLPLSFSITNAGGNYSYPSLPNRFALHPTYKWITGHIGDISMQFSPYTLNGHQFTGAGVDVALDKWQVSAMGGRLLKAVEADTVAGTPPVYERWGYGAKVRYNHTKFYAGVGFFSAADNKNSAAQQADSLGVVWPKSNRAVNVEFGLTAIQNVTLSGEYGMSFMHYNTLLPGLNYTFYQALKLNIGFHILGNTIGVGYERIDPGYATLGAYYFNNDFENITLNYARAFFSNKLNVSANAGFQHDDLAAEKEQSETRFVGAANVNYMPNDRLNLTFSYSGFQTHKNIKSQFDYENELTPYDNLDTLNFTQISQNFTVNTMYTFGGSERRKHSATLMVSYQEAGDKQGDVMQTGSVTRFLNASGLYNLLFVPSGISLSAVFNASYSYAAGATTLIVGPTLNMAAKFLEKKLSTGLSVAYNSSKTQGAAAGSVFNLRCNAGYLWRQRHNFTANSIYQYRSVGNRPPAHSLTFTIAYAFNF